MVRKALLLGAALLAVSATACFAQDAMLEDLYGRGVHAFFAGRMAEAFDSLNAAIASGSRDPRAYYFRGLVLSRTGRAQEAIDDFHKGAELEILGGEPYPVGKSLERIQGTERAALEAHRRATRLAIHNTQSAADRARYEQVKRAEADAVRSGLRGGSPPVPPGRPDPSDPFTAPVVPPAPMPGPAREAAPIPPAAVVPAVPVPPVSDPFAAPAEAAPPARPLPAEAPPEPAPPPPPRNNPPPPPTADPFADTPTAPPPARTAPAPAAPPPATDDPFAPAAPTTPAPVAPAPAPTPVPAIDDPFAPAAPGTPAPAAPAPGSTGSAPAIGVPFLGRVPLPGTGAAAGATPTAPVATPAAPAPTVTPPATDDPFASPPPPAPAPAPAPATP